MRARLSEYYNINQTNVHAYVFGEHGDSSFVPWSVANISGVPIKDCPQLITTPGMISPALDFAEIETYVKKSGGRVIARKGATFYAVSAAVCHICKCLHFVARIAAVWPGKSFAHVFAVASSILRNGRLVMACRRGRK